MNRSSSFARTIRNIVFGATAAGLTGLVPVQVAAWSNADGTFEAHGYLDNTTHVRKSSGFSKIRNRAVIEYGKDFGALGPFSSVRLNGTFRASYDAVYDINDDEWGAESGGPVTIENQGGPAGIVAGSPLTGLPFINAADRVNWGEGFGSSGNPLPPGFFDFFLPPALNGGGFGFDTNRNPNDGLKIVGWEDFKSTGGIPGFGGVQVAYPSRPCNVDSRGCIKDYMDADEDNLRYAEFNDRLDWLREMYLDFEMPVGSGDDLLVMRMGRQQVVWGRTDLFRVLDVINPVDYSIQNIYEELEDSRIPLGILTMEYQMGAIGPFTTLNVQGVWIAEPFRPSNLGQGGQPYSILDAGPTFRAFKNCWDNGCTVGNFAPNNNPIPPLANPGVFGPPTIPTPVGGPGFGFPNGLLATDFPAHSIGIRQANLPDWELEDTQFGMRLEGELKGYGFSLNALSYYSQLPSLHGAQSAVNPFITPGVVGPWITPNGLVLETGGTEIARPYLIAFDIEFPRVFLLGGSLDTYVDSIESTFRIEFAHTNGEEFANTSKPDLYSESNVIRWVVGWDRPTWIKLLNPDRTFILSAQIFGQHILDHDLFKTDFGEVGMPDWKDNFIGTFLIQGNYMNDRLTPQLIMAYDVKAQAGAVAPSVNWLITNDWELNIGFNMKFGRDKNEFDDARNGNPFPPFTDPTFGLSPAGVLPTGQQGIRLGGISPLGIFRSGPLGTAQNEDEFQVRIRYKF